MLASGNYNWLIVAVEKQNQYMQALEQASVEQNIIPLTQFLVKLMTTN
ncbi:MAG: hypothetical protein JKY19_14595 [Alcanivoracaceae bacterium]|nr:hypothetical protein [Alcanivoracaceae bacterium]